MNKTIFLLIFYSLFAYSNEKSIEILNSVRLKSILELKTKSNGIYKLEAYVITLSPHCKCPMFARCKCAPPGILVSDDAKVQNKSAPWGTTQDNELFLECDPDSYELGNKKVFNIRLNKEIPGRHAYSLVKSSEIDVSDTLRTIEDFSREINLRLNSFPGVDEKLINEWVDDNHPHNPFYLKIEYGNDVGSTSDGQPIKGGRIFIVNPNKTTGFLWWKKVKFHALNEPDWTLFKFDSKPLKKDDMEKLSLLLLNH